MNDSMIGVASPGSLSRRRRRRGRNALLRIHRVIGLFLGAVFVLVGLSGSILAYRERLDEQLNASIMRVEIPQKDAVYRPIDELLAAAVAAMPTDGKLERLTMPRQAGSVMAVTYIVETDDLDTYVHQIFVDPYSVKVTGQRLFLHGDDPLSQPLIQILMTFHWTLLLGVNNAYVVGFLGILLFISVLLGLYLWWPVNGDWRLGLKVKWGASAERVVFDLHRSLGVYCAVFLLITLFTGAAMIFKPATRNVVNLLSPVRPDPDFGKSTPSPGRSPIGVGEATEIANKAFPDGRLHWVLFPNTPTAVYIVGKQADYEPNQTKTYRNVGIDQYSGQVLHVQDRARFSGGETFLEWLFPIHSGEAFGGLGRPIALAIGLSPFVFYVTGLTRWLQKRRARRRPAF
ncbi:PepSY-associated TM helix domain-containing protein [Methylocystis sp. JAN1]|uniref:PepSY-associated TM helix domain-containing protein n=1 Tax=Methylocystis sp. JAN1 TaxID=3397211 RepID=UPI003FA1DF1C